MSRETKEWWEYSSAYYQEECRIPVDVHYGAGSPNEKKLNLPGNVKGKKILEIGCGGVQCSIAFALLYVDDLSSCFKEVCRVLKEKGLFVFSLDHLFYRIVDPDSRKRYESDPWFGLWDYNPELLKLVPPTIIFIPSIKWFSPSRAKRK